MAVTYSTTITEIVYTGDPLPVNVAPLTSVGEGETLDLSNGYRVETRTEVFPSSDRVYGQIYDAAGNAIGNEILFASAITGPGGGVHNFQMVDLGSGLFAISATIDPYNDSNDSVTIQIFDSNGQSISGFGAYRSAGSVSFTALPGGGTMVSYAYANATQGPPISYLAFINEDGIIAANGIPASFANAAAEQVAVGDDYVALYNIVPDSVSGADSIRFRLFDDGDSPLLDISLADSTGADMLTPDITFAGDNFIILTWELEGRAGSFARIYDIAGNIVADYNFDPALGTITELGLAENVGGDVSFIAQFSDGVTRQFTIDVTQVDGDGSDDTIVGTSADDTLNGNGGNDTFVGSTGLDVIDGGSGIDTLDFSNATSGQIVSLRDTRADGGTEATVNVEIAIGSDFADVLVGTANAETLNGGGGDDYVYWSGGGDTIDAGADHDGDTFVFFTRPTPTQASETGASGAFETTINLETGLLSATHYNDASLNPVDETILNFEHVIGAESWDTIIGTDADNHLRGEAGNDIIYGGGFGDDILTGGTGNDIFVVAPRDYGFTPIFHQVNANETRITDFTIGEDQVDLAGQGGTYSEFLRGRVDTAISSIFDDGNGNAVLEISMDNDSSIITDRIIFEGVTASDLSESDFILPATSTVGGFEVVNNTVIGTVNDDIIDLSDSLSAFDGIRGEFGEDDITGTNFNDIIYGDDLQSSSGGGNDIIRGGQGIDILYGGDGDDELYGGAGNDRLFGGSGTDDFYGGDGDDELNFELTDIQGGATFDGGDGIDTLYNRQAFGGGPDSSAVITVDLGAANVERYFGSAAGEIIDGRTSTADLIINGNGAAASSIINGIGQDYDVIYGGSGDDYIYANVNDVVHGGAGTDILQISAGNWDVSDLGFEVITASSFVSNNIITAINSPVSVQIFGQGGHDTLTGSDFGDTLTGGTGEDTLYGLEGADTLYGDTGTLDGSDDSLFGGEGDDRLIGGGGNDTLDGGAGSDTAFYSGDISEYTVTDLGAGTFRIAHAFPAAAGSGEDTLTNIEFLNVGGSLIDIATFADESFVTTLTENNDTFEGSSFSETINGLGGNDVIFGNNGDDTIYGGTGNDRLTGGYGIDSLFGEADNDTIIGENIDLIQGGPGDDLITLDLYSPTNDPIQLTSDIFGGEGYDTLTISDSSLYSSRYRLDLTGSSIERAFGSHNNDTLDASGSTVGVTLHGLGGADTLLGGSGDDSLHIDSADVNSGNVNGGTGYDWVYNTDGASLPTLTVNLTALAIEGYYGSNGAEIIDASGIASSVTIYTNLGADQVTTGSGDDYINVSNETVSIDGGAGYDYVFYNVYDGSGLTLDLTASNVEGAVGRAGNDQFDASGNTISASLYGAGGNDILIGGSATDYLYGEAGNDTYTGNGNTDYFLHDNDFGHDTITDFELGTDVMLIRTPGFDEVADVTITQDGADALITVGSNSIRLTDIDAASLTADDFLFQPPGGGASKLSSEAEMLNASLEEFGLTLAPDPIFELLNSEAPDGPLFEDAIEDMFANFHEIDSDTLLA